MDATQVAYWKLIESRPVQVYTTRAGCPAYAKAYAYQGKKGESQSLVYSTSRKVLGLRRALEAFAQQHPDKMGCRLPAGQIAVLGPLRAWMVHIAPQPPQDQDSPCRLMLGIARAALARTDIRATLTMKRGYILIEADGRTAGLLVPPSFARGLKSLQNVEPTLDADWLCQAAAFVAKAKPKVPADQP